MAQESAFDIVSAALIRSFDVSPEDIGPETVLDDIGCDSLAVVELFLKLQEEHGVPMDDSLAGPEMTVAQAAVMFDDARRAGPAAG